METPDKQNPSSPIKQNSPDESLEAAIKEIQEWATRTGYLNIRNRCVDALNLLRKSKAGQVEEERKECDHCGTVLFDQPLIICGWGDGKICSDCFSAHEDGDGSAYASRKDFMKPEAVADHGAAVPQASEVVEEETEQTLGKPGGAHTK